MFEIVKKLKSLTIGFSSPLRKSKACIKKPAGLSKMLVENPLRKSKDSGRCKHPLSADPV
jgi:hypothetical protein